MNAVDAVGEIPRRFRDSNGRLLHKIRLSDFMLLVKGPSLWPPFDHFHRSFVLGDAVCGQDAAPVAGGVDHRPSTHDAAGVENRIAADFREITEQRAKFPQTGVEHFAVNLDLNVAGQRFEIGEHHARADVRFVAQDRIAEVIKMRRGGVVEQQRVLQFGGIPNHAVVAEDDVVADVGIMADLAIAADDGGAFDHGAILDDGAFADEDVLADESDAVAAIVQGGAEVGGEIFLNFLERFPGEFAAVEKCGVLGLAEVKQIGGFEHGASVGQAPRVSPYFF